jgi:hypothetical protein
VGYRSTKILRILELRERKRESTGENYVHNESSVICMLTNNVKVMGCCYGQGT